ncbi:MAG: hypothetical protein AAGC92_01255 [Pseudomonadota bacterium]
MAQKRLTAAAFLAMFAALGAGAPLAADQREGSTFEDLGRETDRLLRDLMRDLSPTLRALEEQLRALDQYQAPEILPNGDIIIRRKRPNEARRDRDLDAPRAPRQRDAEPPGRTRQGEADTPLTDT